MTRKFTTLKELPEKFIEGRICFAYLELLKQSVLFILFEFIACAHHTWAIETISGELSKL